MESGAAYTNKTKGLDDASYGHADVPANAAAGDPERRLLSAADREYGAALAALNSASAPKQVSGGAQRTIPWSQPKPWVGRLGGLRTIDWPRHGTGSPDQMQAQATADQSSQVQSTSSTEELLDHGVALGSGRSSGSAGSPGHDPDWEARMYHADRQTAERPEERDPDEYGAGSGPTITDWAVHEPTSTKPKRSIAAGAFRSVCAELTKPGMLVQELRRVKLMFVGRGRSGKTSLRKALKRVEFDPAEKSTRGTIAEEIFSQEDIKDWAVHTPKPDAYRHATALSIAAVLRHYETLNDVAARRDTQMGKLIDRIRAHLKVEGTGPKQLAKTRYLNQPPGNTVAEPSVEHTAVAPRDEELERLIEDYIDKEYTDRAHMAKSRRGVIISTWDFGGQDLFFPLHHLLLSSSGVFVVGFSLRCLLARPGDVLDSSSNEIEPTIADDQTAVACVHSLVQWLHSIYIYAPGAPVFVVGTGRDCFGDADLERAADLLEPVLNSSPCSEQLQDNAAEPRFYSCFFVDNTRGSAGGAGWTEHRSVTALRAQIERTVLDSQLCPHVSTPTPVEWLKALEQLNSTGKARLTLGEVEQVASQCNFGQHPDISLEDEVLGMLRFFTEAGLLLHYPSLELRDFVILKPHWLIDAATVVVREFRLHRLPCDLVAKKSLQHKLAFASLVEKALLRASLLTILWPAPAYTSSERGIILKLMERYGLIVWLNGTGGDATFLVPALLPNSGGGDVRTRLMGLPPSPAEQQCTCLLQCRLIQDDEQVVAGWGSKTVIDDADVARHGFILAGLFTRLLGKCVDWSHQTNGSQWVLERHRAMLSFGGRKVELAEESDKNRIRVTFEDVPECALASLDTVLSLAREVIHGCSEMKSRIGLTVLLPMPATLNPHGPAVAWVQQAAVSATSAAATDPSSVLFNGRLIPGAEFDAAFKKWLPPKVTPESCYDVLVACRASSDGGFATELSAAFAKPAGRRERGLNVFNSALAVGGDGVVGALARSATMLVVVSITALNDLIGIVPSQARDRCDHVLVEWWFGLELLAQGKIGNVLSLLREVTCFDSDGTPDIVPFKYVMEPTADMLAPEISTATYNAVSGLCTWYGLADPRPRTVREIVEEIVALGLCCMCDVPSTEQQVGWHGGRRVGIAQLAQDCALIARAKLGLDRTDASPTSCGGDPIATTATLPSSRADRIDPYVASPRLADATPLPAASELNTSTGWNDAELEAAATNTDDFIDNVMEKYRALKRLRNAVSVAKVSLKCLQDATSSGRARPQNTARGSTSKPTDVLRFNVGGKRMKVRRSLLTQFPGTLMARMFSGRWDISFLQDTDGLIFLDLNPESFRALTDHLTMLAMGSGDTGGSTMLEPPERDANLDFIVRMFGLCHALGLGDDIESFDSAESVPSSCPPASPPPTLIEDRIAWETAALKCKVAESFEELTVKRLFTGTATDLVNFDIGGSRVSTRLSTLRLALRTTGADRAQSQPELQGNAENTTRDNHETGSAGVTQRKVAALRSIVKSCVGGVTVPFDGHHDMSSLEFAAAVEGLRCLALAPDGDAKQWPTELWCPPP